MRRLLGSVLVLGVCAAWLASVSPALGQESNAAKATRKRLKEKITVEIKETPFKAALEEISRETNNKVKFKIDNVSGISNNSKVTVIAKDKTVEAILNELADKYDFGYYVITAPEGDQVNGKVMVRKNVKKERGYEAGKEPKDEKSSSLRVPGAAPGSITVDVESILLEPLVGITGERFQEGAMLDDVEFSLVSGVRLTNVVLGKPYSRPGSSRSERMAEREVHLIRVP